MDAQGCTILGLKNVMRCLGQPLYRCFWSPVVMLVMREVIFAVADEMVASHYLYHH